MFVFKYTDCRGEFIDFFFQFSQRNTLPNRRKKIKQIYKRNSVWPWNTRFKRKEHLICSGFIWVYLPPVSLISRAVVIHRHQQPLSLSQKQLDMGIRDKKNVHGQ